MIRLAVDGGEQATWREVALRMRGTTIETFPGGASASLPQGCDAVVVAGPARARAKEVERWLRGGMHVLLGVDACLLGDVVELASRETIPDRGRLTIVNPDRYLPSRQTIRQALDAGKLGEPGLVRIHRWEANAHKEPAPSELPQPVLRDLDLACWLIGRLPNAVYAVERAAETRDTSAGRLVQVHLGFSQGGMALIDYTNGLPPGDRYESLSVIGSTGAAYADDHQNMQLLYRGGHPQAVRTEEGVQQFATMTQEFVDALEAGREPRAGATAWRDVIALVQAVERSIDSRQAVTLGGC